MMELLSQLNKFLIHIGKYMFKRRAERFRPFLYAQIPRAGKPFLPISADCSPNLAKNRQQLFYFILYLLTAPASWQR